MKKGLFNIVQGAMAGSESKGKLAAFLAHKFRPDIICMAASPNAGHTVVMGGVKMVSYHLPISWVASKNSKILLGPTSVINLDVLLKEIETLGVPSKKALYIHPRAVMIRRHYVAEEKGAGLLRIGSTNQGVGVARREKLMRADDITFAHMVPELAPCIRDTVEMLDRYMSMGAMVLCEMTQGFDLDLEHGIDPHYCTSKMINPAMAMAEAGVSPRLLGDIYGVLRPYPIRVNNREGSSGPYAEAKEITWREVGLRSGHPDPEGIGEITTTTKLPRRVFEFSEERFRQFVRVCDPDHLCLQFANYLDHSIFKANHEAALTRPVVQFLKRLEELANIERVNYIGTGPEHEDMIDCGYDTDN